MPYRYDHGQTFFNNEKGFRIQVQYPNIVRTVEQTQAVGIHALIGNIGGYIGLFLGNEYLVYHFHNKLKTMI